MQREMRSSGSSILALSMSHDARLRDIQSLCSKLSDRMDTVLSRIPSRSSRALSQAGEIGDLIPRVLEHIGEEVHEYAVSNTENRMKNPMMAMVPSTLDENI